MFTSQMKSNSGQPHKICDHMNHLLDIMLQQCLFAPAANKNTQKIYNSNILIDLCSQPSRPFKEDIHNDAENEN